MPNQIKRNHDLLYLKEDRKKKTKESFKYVYKYSKGFLDSLDSTHSINSGQASSPQVGSAQILDVGCATGDFLYFLSHQYPGYNFTGVDVMPELIARAKKEVPGVKFLPGNICDRKSLPNNKFDAVFMNGTHSIFDDLSWGKNIMHLLSKRGRAYVFGLINPEDVDVLVKTRVSGQKHWEPGWNMFSKKTMAEYFKKNGAKTIFHEFDIGIDLPRHKDDPLRSWTFKIANGKRLVVNGTQLLYQCSLMEIIPKR